MKHYEKKTKENPICLIDFMGVIKMVFLSGSRCKVCSILATAGLMGPVKASSSNHCTGHNLPLKRFMPWVNCQRAVNTQIYTF